MDDLRSLDTLTIEEYMYRSSVLMAGLSTTVQGESAYVSLVRDSNKIPLVMQAIEQNDRQAEALLGVKLTLIQNVLVIHAPAYKGVILSRFAKTQQPYGSFDIAQKILAELSKYERLHPSVFIQLLTPAKIFIDSTDMPHFQFWIDDLQLFESEDAKALNTLRNQRLSRLMLAAFSDDFVPKQVEAFASEIENGTYQTMLELLEGLTFYRNAYYDSDSERHGERIIKMVWKKIQRHMLLIALIVIGLAYGYYWFFYSPTSADDTVLKSRIGDVQFILQPDTPGTEKEPDTYLLDFEDPPNITQGTQDSAPNEIEVPQTTLNEKTESLVISPGDTLFSICEQYYGDGNYYADLAAYNNISNPDLIPIGIRLNIPPLSVLQASD